jgi:NDP-sugar pyrophosphorylase family protein
MNKSSFDQRWNAVILAAGKGKRMLPLSRDTPKVMLYFRGKPILQYIVELFRSANLTKFHVIVSYKREKIVEYFRDGSAYEVRIAFENADERGTLYSICKILSEKRELTEIPLVVSLADSIYPAFLLQEIEESHFNIKPDATIAVSQNLGIAPTHAKLLIENGQVLEINRVDYRIGPNFFADIGLYVLSPTILRKLVCSENPKWGTELIDYLSLMVQERADIRAVVNSGKWYAFHTPKDFACQVT